MPPASRRCKTRRGIERECGRIVFGHFQEHLLGLSRQGFRCRFTEENARKARTARMWNRADAENFRLLRGDLDQDEALRFSRRRILGRKGENTLPCQQRPKRCFVPGILETLAMKRCEERGIVAARNAARCAHGTTPGSFASGARK